MHYNHLWKMNNEQVCLIQVSSSSPAAFAHMHGSPMPGVQPHTLRNIKGMVTGLLSNRWAAHTMTPQPS